MSISTPPVRLREVAGEHAPRGGAYDTLIVATGAQYNYFGHDGWRTPAPNLKTLEGALAIRRQILEAFEAAELEPDPRQRRAWLTFVVVGAGPTGVEMAGQIAEIARDLRGDFRSLGPSKAQHPARRSRRPGPAGVPAFTLGAGGAVAGRSRRHHRSLERRSIDIDASSVTLEDRDGDAARSPRGRRSGQRASSPRLSPGPWPHAPARTWIEPGASRSCTTSHCPVIPR